jgi:prepilin-type N-terminal cleavage/methylation domain-containing protein
MIIRTVTIPRAFTLIELLVTIATCAILAGLAFPSLTAARARSRTAVCLNNLHQLSVAWTLYSADYGERLASNIGGGYGGSTPEYACWVYGVVSYKWKNNTSSESNILTGFESIGPYSKSAKPLSIW